VQPTLTSVRDAHVVVLGGAIQVYRGVALRLVPSPRPMLALGRLLLRARRRYLPRVTRCSGLYRAAASVKTRRKTRERSSAWRLPTSGGHPLAPLPILSAWS
jgi:hypothetical protein